MNLIRVYKARTYCVETQSQHVIVSKFTLISICYIPKPSSLEGCLASYPARPTGPWSPSALSAGGLGSVFRTGKDRGMLFGWPRFWRGVVESLPAALRPAACLPGDPQTISSELQGTNYDGMTIIGIGDTPPPIINSKINFLSVQRETPDAGTWTPPIPWELRHPDSNALQQRGRRLIIYRSILAELSRKSYINWQVLMSRND